jgi:hypothetical protein
LLVSFPEDLFMTDQSAPAPTRKPLLSFLTADAFKPVDPLAVAKMTPAVTARRVRLQKYVKMVVAGCAALCLVAGVRVAVASEPDDSAHALDATAAVGAVHKAASVKSLVSLDVLRAHGVTAQRWGASRHR